jgi:hypothetical protein
VSSHRREGFRGGEAIPAWIAATSSVSAETATLVAPTVRHVIADVGTAHATNGVSALGLAPQYVSTSATSWVLTSFGIARPLSITLKPAAAGIGGLVGDR